MEKIEEKQRIIYEIRKWKKDIIFWIIIVLIFVCEKEIVYILLYPAQHK